MKKVLSRLVLSSVVTLFAVPVFADNPIIHSTNVENYNVTMVGDTVQITSKIGHWVNGNCDTSAHSSNKVWDASVFELKDFFLTLGHVYPFLGKNALLVNHYKIRSVVFNKYDG